MTRSALTLASDSPFRRLVGVGGIGTGLFFALEGEHDLGRNESRPGRLLDARDYCKLHIVAHYPAVLLGACAGSAPFQVLPVGKIGCDEPGRRSREEMAAAGMDTRFVESVSGHPTLLSVCFQYPDGSGGNITATDSAAALLQASDIDAAQAFLGPEAIALAVPEVPLPARRHLLRLATQAGALRAAAFNSAEIAEARALGCFSEVDLVSLNEDEAAALAGASWDADAPGRLLAACAEALQRQQPSSRAVVTAGAHGAFAFDGRGWQHATALPVEVAGTAGAGDALLGGVLTGLAAGLPFVVPGTPFPERPLSSAFDLGVLLAALAVTSPHTIPPGVSLDTLLAFAARHDIRLGEAFRRLLCDGPGQHAR